MTLRARATGLAVLVACMAVLGCGSDDEGQPIPAAEADGLLGQLDSIQSRFENSVDACLEITEGDDTNTAVVEDILASLPRDVEARDALEESFDRLFQLTSEQCAEQQAEPDQTDTEPEPTDTEPQPTDTDPTDTTETDLSTDTDTTDTGTDTTDTGAEPPPGETTSPDEGDSGGTGAPGGED